MGANFSNIPSTVASIQQCEKTPLWNAGGYWNATSLECNCKVMDFDIPPMLTGACEGASFYAACTVCMLNHQDNCPRTPVNFTEPFIALKNEYAFLLAVAFIDKWGGFILDTATMGASLTSTMYIESGASKDAVDQALKQENFTDKQQAILTQDSSTARSGIRKIGQSEYTSKTTSINRIGEFSKAFQKKRPSTTQDQNGYEDGCAIGSG